MAVGLFHGFRCGRQFRRCSIKSGNSKANSSQHFGSNGSGGFDLRGLPLHSLHFSIRSSIRNSQHQSPKIARSRGTYQRASKYLPFSFWSRAMIRRAACVFESITARGFLEGNAARNILERPSQRYGKLARSPQDTVLWRHSKAHASVLRQLWTHAGSRLGQRRGGPASRWAGSSRAQTSSTSGPSRLFHFSSPRKSSTKSTAVPHSLSARLKKLSREYGWAAVGVYLGLSVLDFPFCFLLVRTLGTERIGEYSKSPLYNTSRGLSGGEEVMRRGGRQGGQS